MRLPTKFLMQLGKLILKLIWKAKWARSIKIILKNKNNEEK